MDNSKIKKRLSKFLALAGVASRRACEELIFAGRVKVNHEVVNVPQTLVNSKDVIEVDDQRIGETEAKVYFMLNKPAGYICTSKKTGKSKIVLDLFEDVKERIFTIGRLDKDTEGLLLVTNDGHFANSVIHPSANISKEYLVKTDHEVTDTHLKTISNGTMVEGVFVKPLKVVKIRRGTVKVTISEGKKREVRHLFQTAGLEVVQLTRIRIGGLVLGALPVGQWRPLKEKEKEIIFQ